MKKPPERTPTLLRVVSLCQNRFTRRNPIMSKDKTTASEALFVLSVIVLTNIFVRYIISIQSYSNYPQFIRDIMSLDDTILLLNGIQGIFFPSYIAVLSTIIFTISIYPVDTNFSRRIKSKLNWTAFFSITYIIFTTINVSYFIAYRAYHTDNENIKTRTIKQFEIKTTNDTLQAQDYIRIGNFLKITKLDGKTILIGIGSVHSIEPILEKEK